MEIVFASSKGSQYRYFKSLCGRLSCASEVVTLMPVFFMSWWKTGLTKDMVISGIKFHLQRKQAKYRGKKLPDWMWCAYKYRAAMRFCIIYLRFTRYFKLNQPKIVGLWNGHRLPEMAIKFAARKYGIKVLHFENGLLPDTTTADFKGVNDLNSVPRNSDFYESRKSEVEDKSFKLIQRKPHKSKKNQSLSSVDLTKRYIFVPFQVGFDSQVLLNSNWIQTMDAFFHLLCELVDQIRDKEIVFVIKEHPSDPHSFSAFHNHHPRIKFSQENTEKLIQSSKGVITINSSVGLESILLGRKVVVLGEACYKIDGLVCSANNLAQLISVTDNLSGWRPNPIIRAEFIAYLDKHYCIPGAWQLEELYPTNGHVKGLDALIFDGLCENQTVLTCIESKRSDHLELQLNIH